MRVSRWLLAAGPSSPVGCRARGQIGRPGATSRLVPARGRDMAAVHHLREPRIAGIRYVVAREECCLAGAEVCLEARPADGSDKLHEGVFDVDSLVEPGAEEVGLSAVAAFFGSHAHPRLQADGVLNHARARGSICRKRHLQPAQTGEYEYLPRAKTHVRSKACKFFTDD